MEKKIYLMPRRSGKSMLADYEFSKEPKSTMFIGYNNNMLQRIDSYKSNEKSFFTQRSNLNGLSFNRAVIDEYLFFDLKGLKNVYENLRAIGVKNLFVFTSVNYIDKEMFDFIKLCKSKNIYWKSEEGESFYPNGIREKFERNNHKQNEELIENLDKLYFNFLTDLDAEIIMKPTKHNKFFEIVD